MIVDTSALIAVLREEDDYLPILRALSSEQGFIPAPVLTEFMRACMRKGHADPVLIEFIDAVLAGPIAVSSFDAADARASMLANKQHGSGLGTGGKLNLLDLMVYATARNRDLPILCTGTDFASTDARIHPASRKG